MGMDDASFLAAFEADWRASTLDGPVARRHGVEPDLQPLP